MTSKIKNVVPSKYYNKLSKSDTKKQLSELKKSRNSYKKGVYYTRKKMPSFINSTSPYVKKFEKKYGVKITDLKSVSKLTGIPVEALEKIINKGMGAYYSSGSRPNQNPWSWGFARLASVIVGGKALKIDQHILDDYNIKIIIEPKKKANVPDCKKMTNKTVKNHKKCRRSNGKEFDLPRKFPPSKCKKPKGFTMKASCAPFQ